MNNFNVDSLQCCLEEHRALREHITSDMESMRHLTIVNVAALGSIIAVALSDANNWLILLVIPWISCLLGLTAYFHSRRVSQVGLYIRDILYKRLADITGQENVMEWESYLRTKEEERPYVTRLFSISGMHLLGFAISSVLAIALPANLILHSTYPLIALWGVDIILTLTLFATFFNERNFWFGKKREPKAAK